MSEADFEGVGSVRQAHVVDAAALSSWMAARIAGFEPPLEISQFNGGQSNPTYLLQTPTARYVLRRKPPGELLKGAHAIEREARVLKALGQIGFPVPLVHALCEDPAVIGTPFYVMDMVEGRTFWDPAMPGERSSTRSAVFDAMNQAIASLHIIDPALAGLEDFGRAEGYVHRQINRWSQQYREDEAAGRDPHMDRLIDWLPDRMPADDEIAVVHGDFRIDNMIFARGGSRLLAALDWELSTLGHPLADFAYHLMMYRMPPLTIPGLVGADLDALGIPSEDAYVEAYCRRTGRTGIPDLDAWLAFTIFRFAAICHGIRGRIARGTASSPHASRLAADLPLIAEVAWQQAKRAGA